MRFIKRWLCHKGHHRWYGMVLAEETPSGFYCMNCGIDLFDA